MQLLQGGNKQTNYKKLYQKYKKIFKIKKYLK